MQASRVQRTDNAARVAGATDSERAELRHVRHNGRRARQLAAVRLGSNLRVGGLKDMREGISDRAAVKVRRRCYKARHDGHRSARDVVPVVAVPIKHGKERARAVAEVLLHNPGVLILLRVTALAPRRRRDHPSQNHILELQCRPSLGQ